MSATIQVLPHSELRSLSDLTDEEPRWEVSPIRTEGSTAAAAINGYLTVKGALVGEMQKAFGEREDFQSEIKDGVALSAIDRCCKDAGVDPWPGHPMPVRLILREFQIAPPRFDRPDEVIAHGEFVVIPPWAVSY